jgi:two-component sensor histidine kinase
MASFGTDLIKMLSQKLKGTIEVDSDTGYATTITFDRFKILEV